MKQRAEKTTPGTGEEGENYTGGGLRCGEHHEEGGTEFAKGGR